MTMIRNEDLDIEEAGAYLDCSPRTIQRRRSQGLGPIGYRVGSKIRFTIEELEAVKHESREQRRTRNSQTG